MSSTESPLNTVRRLILQPHLVIDHPGPQAHQHAANADDFMSQGLLIPASEQHNQAAQRFQECIEATNDENVQ
jgi:hypothetical protein